MAMTCQVFGARAGRSAAKRASQQSHHDCPRALRELNEYLMGFARTGSEEGPRIRAELQQLANRYLLILRSGQGLSVFLSELDALQVRLRRATAVSCDAWVALLETDMKQLALGALRRIQKLPELVKSFFQQPECWYIKT